MQQSTKKKKQLVGGLGENLAGGLVNLGEVLVRYQYLRYQCPHVWGEGSLTDWRDRLLLENVRRGNPSSTLCIIGARLIK